MALAAARMNDLQACDSHGPAPLPDGALHVKVNSQPTVRVGDAFSCGGCPNRVKTGASTVTIGGEFAARLTDASDHKGWIVVGSGNVRIGGPTGMGTIGAGKGTCQAMAAGRTSGKASQSYGNCVLESVRQIIRRATGNEVTEEELKKYAEAHGCVFPGANGGSNGELGRKLLEDHGVRAERMPAEGPATLGVIAQAVSERRGVVAFIDPHEISPSLYPDPGNHAVAVTGVELDANGDVIAVFINDTGAGECGKRVPAAEFGAGLRNLPSEKANGGAKLLVTKGAIW